MEFHFIMYFGEMHMFKIVKGRYISITRQWVIYRQPMLKVDFFT